MVTHSTCLVPAGVRPHHTAVQQLCSRGAGPLLPDAAGAPAPPHTSSSTGATFPPTPSCLAVRVQLLCSRSLHRQHPQHQTNTCCHATPPQEQQQQPHSYDPPPGSCASFSVPTSGTVTGTQTGVDLALDSATDRTGSTWQQPQQQTGWRHSSPSLQQLLHGPWAPGGAATEGGALVSGGGTSSGQQEASKQQDNKEPSPGAAAAAAAGAAGEGVCWCLFLHVMRYARAW
jgi:hypothetical protein